MAIVLKANNEKTYVSSTGLISDREKQRADLIDKELEERINNLEKSFLRRGLVNRIGKKKDALRIWYELGLLLNEIGIKNNIFGTTDEIYYWQAVYDHISPLLQKQPPPKNFRDLVRNHFYHCGIIAREDWEFVKSLGNWSVWRDILDNKILLSDPRVFRWVLATIKSMNLGHKELRPFIHATRRRFSKIDTKVLNDEELILKLKSIKL